MDTLELRARVDIQYVKIVERSLCTVLLNTNLTYSLLHAMCNEEGDMITNMSTQRITLTRRSRYHNRKGATARRSGVPLARAAGAARTIRQSRADSSTARALLSVCERASSPPDDRHALPMFARMRGICLADSCVHATVPVLRVCVCGHADECK